MEKTMRPRKAGARGPFLRRLPLVATLMTSLILSPPALSAPACRKPAVAKAFKLPQLLSQLGAEDTEKALSAARRLSRMGEQAVMPLLDLVRRCGEPELSRRALAVLSHIDWGTVCKQKRALAVSSVHPFLKRFGENGRASESILAEMVMLSIGDDAMPRFNKMLSGQSRLDRMLAIAALLQVDWRRIDYVHASAIRKSLKGLADDALRDVAKELIRRIGKTFVMCMDIPESPEGVV